MATQYSGYYAYEENNFLRDLFGKCLERFRMGQSNAFAGMKIYLRLILNGGRIWDLTVQVRLVVWYANQLLELIARVEAGDTSVVSAPATSAVMGGEGRVG